MTGSLIDFHCHLDLYPDFEDLVGRCDERRIYTLAVTTTPKAWPRNRAVCERTTHVRAGLGLHPQLVAERWRELSLWEKHLPETRYIGEVGLDASPRHYRSLDRQKEVFRAILKACASERQKILSVHSVMSARPVLDMIEEHLPKDRGTVVLHWFTGSVAEARRAANLGCFFSVNERMLRDEKGTKFLQSLPVERLLTETDGPFTADGDTPLRPENVAVALRAIAKSLGQDVELCKVLLVSNLKALLDGVQPHSTKSSSSWPKREDGSIVTL